MLFVHDVYSVIGEHEFDFQDAFRNEYLPVVADDDTRVLWYLYASHGSGEAYNAYTVTAVRNGTAWERLAQRLRYGDLADWYMRVSAMRYAASTSLLVATDWSPLADVDLDAIPVGDVEHPVGLFREDTLEGDGVDAALSNSPALRGNDDDILTCRAAFRPAMGADTMVRVLYRVAAPERLAPAFGADSGFNDWPGSLTPTLPDGVRGAGRYIKSTSWSPIG